MSHKVDFYYAFSELKITELAGVRLRDYYQDLSLMIESQKKAFDVVYKEIGEKRGVSLDIGHVVSAGVVGCKLVYPENNEPWAEPCLQNTEEIEGLEVPEPKYNPLVQGILDKAKRFEKLTGVKPNVGFEGPVTTAALCRGIRDFFFDVYKNPELSRKLVEKVTDAIIEWKKYHESEMGIQGEMSISLADDDSAHLSPRHYRGIALPYQLKWYEAFPERKMRHLHNCGNTTHLLEMIKELRLTSFEMGEKTDLAKARRILEKTKLNKLFDLRILLSGSVDEIVDHTRSLIMIGAPGKNFGIGIEGWKGITFERVRLVKYLVERYNESGEIGSPWRN